MTQDQDTLASSNRSRGNVGKYTSFPESGCCLEQWCSFATGDGCSNLIDGFKLGWPEFNSHAYLARFFEKWTMA
jgi:hypothetical protein